MQKRYNYLIVTVITLLIAIVYLTTITKNHRSNNEAETPIGIQVKKLLTHADSLAEVTPSKSEELLNSIPPEAFQEMDRDDLEAHILLIKGMTQVSTGNLKKGYLQIEEGLMFFEDRNDSLSMADGYKKLGVALREMGKYDQALQLLLKSLTIYEPKNKHGDIAYLNNAIGFLYLNTKNYPRALEYFSKAKKYYDRQTNTFGLAKVMNNIGIAYLKMGQNVPALESLEKALELKQNLNPNGNFANTLSNIGLVCTELNLYNKAIDYFNKAIVQYRQQKDKWGEANTLNNLSKVYLKMRKVTIAHSISTANQKMINLVGTPDLKIENLEIEFLVFQQKKDFKNALNAYIAYTDLKDSVFSENKQRIIEDVEEQYESAKKAKEIQTLSHNQEIQNTKIKLQTYIGILLGISVILLGGLLIILAKRYQTKKNEHSTLKIKQLEIEEKNLHLERVLLEVEEKSEQLKKQRDIAKLQKNQLSNQKEEITNSIRYAARIQRAVLESRDLDQSHLPAFFALFRPREIVSGDFYWVRETENYSIFVVADCTGHGVPGAFMSLLGVAFLNEIISQKNNPQPHDILNSLRAKIITSLHQSSKDPINNDGMDASVLFVDKKRKKALYSGSNSDLFIVRKSELIEIYGDKMPIGYYYIMDPFTTKEIPLMQDDCIYLGTDGFSDQFGGPEGKKFRVKGLKNILLQIGDKPLEQQKNILECSFDAWKGNNIQIDDMLILGIKI